MMDDPYTLFVATSLDGTAQGTLYVDDGETFEYKNGKFLYINLEYSNRKLTARFIDKSAKFAAKNKIERVVILGTKAPSSNEAVLEVTGPNTPETSKLPIKYDPDTLTTVVRKPDVLVSSEWSITLPAEIL